MAKKIVCTVIAAVLILAAAPVTLLSIGIFGSPRFADTYYGELAPMYENLKGTEGKKIVIVGTSSVAFGVDSALIEENLRAEGYDYSVVNFGLYGALGTKVMLDLSERYIGEGDIVIFAPEPEEQCLSLFFSAENMWYALDGNFGLFFRLDTDDMGSMVGNYASFVSEKFSYMREGTCASPSGVYARDSFDDNCDMRYERHNNQFRGGVDTNNMITLSPGLFSDDFIDYVNEYASSVRKKGGEIYYSFCPMNRDAVTDCSDGAIDEYYTFIDESFDMEIISDPNMYLYESGWFYDSNVHMNSAGQTMHSVNLLNDIKSLLGSAAPTDVEIPEMPELLSFQSETEGDDGDSVYFTYEDTGGEYRITGVTEEGRALRDLTVPTHCEGVPVTDYDASAFNNLGSLTSITFQTNIGLLYDSSFAGCTSLKEIHILETDPGAISVGLHLLDGIDAANIKIYVPSASFSAYSMDYWWGSYTGNLAREQ